MYIYAYVYIYIYTCIHICFFHTDKKFYIQLRC